MSDFALKFITRDNCHLCDSARPLIHMLADRYNVGVTEIDVDESTELVDQFGSRVPVVLGPAGQVLAEGRIGARELRRAIKKAR